jgi:hypothetical protein
MTNPLNHACLNYRRCQPGDQPRTTQTPNTLCDPCTLRATRHIANLPAQHLRLRAMLTDHTPTTNNPRRAAPDSTVLINTAVDALLGAIHHHATMAAEIVADALNTADPYRHDPTAHVHACCALTAPNVPLLLGRGVVDIMAWNRAGTHRYVTTTTGTEIIQHLDYLGAVAHYTLGYTRARSYRDLPCARCHHRTVGRWAGADTFDCETCGTQFPEADIRRHDRILLERHRRGLLHA